MAKKDVKKGLKSDVSDSNIVPGSSEPKISAQEQMLKSVPPELQEKLKALQGKLEDFKKKVLAKFDKYITGISLLPPPKKTAQGFSPLPGIGMKPLPGMPDSLTPQQVQQPKPEDLKKEDDDIHVFVLVDDSEPSKMPKWELLEKTAKIIDDIAKEVDDKIKPRTFLLSEIWQSCYDSKYDLLQLVALSAPIHDTGMLKAIKIAEVHKSMVLKKFEKYIVAYVLAGSLVQGKASQESDIDVFIVIDDTDVKKMTRFELKDKLRAIIIGMGLDAGDITGIHNKLNIQVYILTDFWDSVKEANPVIFTFLRDGVPFYDRGIFMPWKQLLKMGKVKPSPEAIDLYMSGGEQTLERVRLRIKEIGMEDIFWALQTPSQAALMLYGLPPPTPKETPEVLREIFVKKEGLLKEEDVAVMQKVIDTRKSLEHGTRKALSGKELDELLESAENYLKRLKKLFTQIEDLKERESIVHSYESAITSVRDALVVEGLKSIPEETIVKDFKKVLVDSGKLPAKSERVLEMVLNAKKHLDSGKISKDEVVNTRKESLQFIRMVTEFVQRARGKELEKSRIRVKHGDKFGEVLLLENDAFIITDVDAQDREVQKALINPDGSLGTIVKSSVEDLEKALVSTKLPRKAFIKGAIFRDIEKIFGSGVEVLLQN